MHEARVGARTFLSAKQILRTTGGQECPRSFMDAPCAPAAALVSGLKGVGLWQKLAARMILIGHDRLALPEGPGAANT